MSNRYLTRDVAEMCEAMGLIAKLTERHIGAIAELSTVDERFTITVAQYDRTTANLSVYITRWKGSSPVATVAEAVFYDDPTGEATVTFIATVLQREGAGPEWAHLNDLTVRDVELRTLDVVVRHLLGAAWTLDDHRTVKTQLLRALDTVEVAP